MSFGKKAVDEAAKKYFKLLWDDFGEALTRDIPRKIKAALLDNKKVASVDGQAMIIPVAHAKSGNEYMLEGMYNSGTEKLMFLASLDKDGNVVSIKSFDIK